MYFPEIIEGESITGFYIRFLQINGLSVLKQREVLTDSNDCKVKIAPWVFRDIHISYQNTATLELTAFMDFLTEILTPNEVYERTPLSIFDTINFAIDDLKTAHSLFVVYRYKLREVLSFPLVYCDSCREEQIKRLGHIVFLTAWQNPFAPYCFRHNRYLQSARGIISSKVDKELPTTSQPNLELLTLFQWFIDLKEYNLGYIDEFLQQEILNECKRRFNSNIRRSRILYGADYLTFVAKKINNIFNQSPMNNPTISSAFLNHLNFESLQRMYNHSHSYTTVQFWTICFIFFRAFDNFILFIESIDYRGHGTKKEFYNSYYSPEDLKEALTRKTLEDIIGPYSAERLKAYRNRLGVLDT